MEKFNVEDFVKTANPENLALAKAKVEEEMATEEQEMASIVFSSLKNDLDTCNREIKKFQEFKKEVEKKLKPFLEAKLPKAKK